MARKIHSPFKAAQEKYRGSVLCSDHAEYYEMPKGSCKIIDPSGDPNEPIQCEVCSMGAMRKCGVI